MSRKFIASVLAASLALTSFSAAPAKAGNDDLMRFLAGATTLVILGNALDGSYRDSGSSRTVQNGRDRSYDYDRGRNVRNNDRNRQGYRAHSNRENRLPPGCLTRARTSHGKQQVFGKACLREHYAHTSNLPRACRVQPTGHNAPRRAYSAGCLFDRGYYAARR